MFHVSSVQNPHVIHFDPGWLRTGFPVKMDKMDTDTPNILDKVDDAQANHQSSFIYQLDSLPSLQTPRFSWLKSI